MPSYTLEIEAFGVFTTNAPSLEIWEDGVLDSTHSISASGTTISLTINYGGALPTSLALTFNDAFAAAGRTIEIRSVKINDKYVNTGNYLSADSLSKSQSATVDIANSDFIFDASEPALSEFTTGATRTMTVGGDSLRVFSSGTAEIFDALGGRDVLYLGSGNDKVFGNTGNDIIRAGAGNDLISGGDGADRILGQDGDDTLYGGNGNDAIQGGNGADEIHGGAGDDRLNGQDGNDVITGGAGDDKINGGDGDDILYGGADDDQIVGGAGVDTIDGGAGEDLAYGGAGDDIINGGDGIDTLIGNFGDDEIHGDAGNDTILGMEDNDTLYGGADNDQLYGGIGDDVLDGGAGADTLYGDLGGLKIVMEANQLDVTQTSDTQWHSVNFSGLIDNAVIKLFANDVTSDPFTLRVRNVTKTGFEFQLDEYEYQDGITGLETISWVAVASGTHTLSNGSVIQAGYTTATNEITSIVSFNSTFSTTPVVFSQLSSNNEAEAAVTRNFNVTTSGFRAMMHEQEANAVSHATEDIGWIAIEAGGSTASGILAGTTGDVVTHDVTNISYATPFSGMPVLIADAQTNDGGDPGVVAGSGGSTSAGTGVFFDEEASANTEVSHTDEDVGYLAIEAGAYTTAGQINGSDTLYGGDGNDILYADVVEDLMVASPAIIFPMAKEILGDGAVAYWTLDETSGTTFDNLGSLDSSVDGSSTGSPTLGAAGLYTTDVGAVDFDGVNDGILIPDSAGINTGTYTEKTVELVFNADDVTTRQVLYEEGGGTHGLAIYLDGGNVYVTGEEDTVWVDANINAAVSTGTTYHVAFVFDQPSNSFEGFLNGVSMGSVTVGNSIFPSHAGDIGIGYSPDAVQFHDGEGGAGYYFDGRITDVAIYTTALTQAQLQDHADIVAGTLPASSAGAIDDTLYGGDGLDIMYGGAGRDVFVFESASAFNDVDVINAFDVGENDAIDISDLLTGYVDGVSDINDFVQLTESGGNTLVGIDANGTTGGVSFTDIASITDFTGASAGALLNNESIIAA